MQRVDHAEAPEGGEEGGQLILCCYYIGELRSFFFRRGAQHRHTKPPRCITTAPWSSNFLNNACSPPPLSLSLSDTHRGSMVFQRITSTHSYLFIISFSFFLFFWTTWFPPNQIIHPRVDCSSAPPTPLHHHFSIKWAILAVFSAKQPEETDYSFMSVTLLMQTNTHHAGPAKAWFLHEHLSCSYVDEARQLRCQ